MAILRKYRYTLSHFDMLRINFCVISFLESRRCFATTLKDAIF
jgi:hypothetical protein